MARVGGVVFPKQLHQFEAVALHNGPDGKPNTDDDLPLEAVDRRLVLEEYTATFDDDDLKFVGAIDAATGLFTPNVDGPNPERSGERNNIGDVWVVASYRRPAPRRRCGPAPTCSWRRRSTSSSIRRSRHEHAPSRDPRCREHHRFEAAGQPFVYLVPSAAIFALRRCARRVMRSAARAARRRRPS